MASREEIYQAILNADKAGDGNAVRVLGSHLAQMDSETAPKEFRQSVDSQAANPARSPAYIKGMSAPRRDEISMLQGPTLGFADELAGVVGGGYGALTNGRPFSENYQESRDFVRGASDQAMRDKPAQNMLTQMIASAPVGLAGMAKNAAYPVLRAMGIGGAMGAVSGAGGSEETSPLGVAKDAGVGLAVAGALPAVVTPIARGVGAVARNISSRFNDSAAMNYAKQKVAEAFSRDAPKVGDVITRADSRMAKLGDEARVADAGGASVRGLLDTIATLPGETKNAVEAAIRLRQSTRGGRLVDAANQGLGADGARLAPTLERLIEERRTAAAPLYNDLYKKGVFVNDDLRQIIDAAHQLGAGGQAKRIAVAEQRDYGLTPDAKWSGMRELDYLKQGLDDIIEASKNPQTGAMNKVGFAVDKLRRELVQTLDASTNGAYATARAAYEGPSKIMDAARAGRQAMTKDDATIQGLTASMSPAELDGFRVGAFEALRGKLGKEGGQTEILKMWKEPATQEKLKAIFPDERTFREFASKVAAEARMKGLDSVGRGSQTAARQYGAGDVDVQAGKDFAGAVADTKTGNIAGLLSKGASAWNRVATPEPVRDAMGRILLSQGASGRNELMNIQEIARQVAAARGRNAQSLGVASGAGTQAGRNILQDLSYQDPEVFNPMRRH